MENQKKDNSKKKGVCWECGQLKHLKKDCQRRNRARLASSSRSDIDSIANGKSLGIVGDNGLL